MGLRGGTLQGDLKGKQTHRKRMKRTRTRGRRSEKRIWLGNEERKKKEDCCASEINRVEGDEVGVLPERSRKEEVGRSIIVERQSKPGKL